MSKANKETCLDAGDSPRCSEIVQLAVLVQRHPALSRAMARVDKADDDKKLELLCEALDLDKLRNAGVPLPPTASTDFKIDEGPGNASGRIIRICPVITLGIPPLTVSIPLECRDVEIPNPFS